MILNIFIKTYGITEAGMFLPPFSKMDQWIDMIYTNDSIL